MFAANFFRQGRVVFAWVNRLDGAFYRFFPIELVCFGRVDKLQQFLSVFFQRILFVADIKADRKKLVGKNFYLMFFFPKIRFAVVVFYKVCIAEIWMSEIYRLYRSINCF